MSLIQHNLQIWYLEVIDTPDHLPGGTGRQGVGRHSGMLPGEWVTA